MIHPAVTRLAEKNMTAHRITTRAAARTAPEPDPDRPVPFTLTPKAHAALRHESPAPAASEPVMYYCGCGYPDCSACAGYGWACHRCGAAWHGTPPGDPVCPGGCQAAA